MWFKNLHDDYFKNSGLNLVYYEYNLGVVVCLCRLLLRLLLETFRRSELPPKPNPDDVPPDPNPEPNPKPFGETKPLLPPSPSSLASLRSLLPTIRLFAELDPPLKLKFNQCWVRICYNPGSWHATKGCNNPASSEGTLFLISVQWFSCPTVVQWKAFLEYETFQGI